MAIDHFVTRSVRGASSIDLLSTTGYCNVRRPRGRAALGGAARAGAARGVVASPEVVILTLTRPHYRGSDTPGPSLKPTHPFCCLRQPVLGDGQSDADKPLAPWTEG
jgi:hypothetical protein